jgi:oligopeptide transport system permease protein
MSDRNLHYVAPVDESEQVEIDRVKLSARKSTLWLDAWRDLRRRPLFYIAVVIVVFITLMALFPTWFTDLDPRDATLSKSNFPPEDGHPLGFTRQGQDIWARIVYGASTSVAVGLITVAITAVLGIPMGAIAGFFGGWVDSLLSRIGDIFFSLPYFLAAVVVMTVLSDYRNVWVISLAIGVFAWATLARIVRAEVLQVKQQEYVQASTSLGRSRMGTLINHVLPNAITPAIAYLTLALGAAIVAEATLSFLGIGLPSSIMSWGNDIAQASTTVRTAPMPLIYPSIALTVTVLAFTILGELLRDALDPKARARR